LSSKPQLAIYLINFTITNKIQFNINHYY